LLGDDPLPLFDVLANNIEPIESRWIIKPGQEIKPGAKIALFQFPLDRALPIMEVKVGAKFPVQIATGDKKGPTVCLQETLELIRSVVAEARLLAARAEAEEASQTRRAAHSGPAASTEKG
jgi:hypothetical protein